MIKPDCESIRALADEYSIIPICREIYADVITPIVLLRKFAEISKRFFLLESSRAGKSNLTTVYCSLPGQSAQCLPGLRTTNPSPYMVYLHIDGDEIMSTSPETLVRLQSGRLVTFPVAGSRPRGKTDA